MLKILGKLEEVRIAEYLIILVVTLFFMCLAAPFAQSQSLAGTDLTTIKVDNLSDEQLLQYYQQAEQSGYTQTQLENIARQRGMPESEIAKLRRRIKALSSNVGQSSQSMTNSQARDVPLLSPDEVFGRLGTSQESVLLTETQQKIFGFELFRTNKLTFTPNLAIPTPTDYVLSAGDELSIDLWGDTQQYMTLTISPEGTIRIQDLSPVYVNGLSIKQAEVRIIDRLSEIYSGIKKSDTQEQGIFYQISLGNTRTINVTIVGEVELPGNYALNSLSTVFTLLHASGGPKENGSFRMVKLLRNNKLKSTIDLYDFLVNGTTVNDEILQNGDVVIVGLYKKRVEVLGEVKRPRIFEMANDENLATLMEYAGGFSSSAFKSFITVTRNSDKGTSILNVNKEDFEQFVIEDGDVIEVRETEGLYENRVQVEGAVNLAGEYQLIDDMSVRTLIRKAGGLKGDAFLNRASIHRMEPDYSQRVIPFDLSALLNGSIDDIPLQNEDVIMITSIYDLKEEYFVEIRGEVALSGAYPFFKEMTVEDLVMLSGGLSEGASGGMVEIVRRNRNGVANSLSEVISISIDRSLGFSDSENTMYLKPFDQVFIRSSPAYHTQRHVTLEGEVNRPGVYGISRKDERISDVLTRAGGITPYAYPEGALLVRKNEFENEVSGVDLEALTEFYEKIEGDTSIAINKAREELIRRLGVLIEQKKQSDKRDSSNIANRFKRQLTEELTDADSIGRPVNVNEQEATVLDLVEILNNPGSKYDYILRDGDVISIPEELETIRVTGEVISPLNLRYDQQFEFKDYINDAGGFTVNARKGRSYVQYPNGRRKQARRFLFFKFYPKIEPGSTIYVSRKPERSRLGIQEVLAITSSLATITFLVDRIGNSN